MTSRQRAQRPEAPSPELCAREALEAVVRALADTHQPERDHGVAVLHAFASDRMRSAIGGPDAFRRALVNELYAPLVNAAAIHAEGLDQRGDSARATVVARDGAGVTARFTVALARARHGDRKGCWLLSGMAREGVDL
ncbi:MAG TPA: hypothetical protein VKB31_01125 [Trueperaceae bacterium]|nr:hypothetical protein [Trueperaceae bacterium]